MYLRVIWGVVWIRIPFLLKANNSPNYITFCLSIQNSHPGCFHLLAIVTGAAMSMGVRVSA